MILRVAWRYVIAKKNTQAVQIISWVSIGAMAVATACLIMVLSVFNGFDSFIKNLYGDYYPDVKITAMKGSTFPDDSLWMQQIAQAPEVAHVSRTLEQKILLAYDESQSVALLKGVDEAYEHTVLIRKHVQHGDYALHSLTDAGSILVGIGLANRLGCSEESTIPLNAYAFLNGLGTPLLNPEGAYSSLLFSVNGIFILQEDIDNQLAITSLESAQQLSRKEGRISAIEIRLKPQAEYENLKRRIEKNLQAKNLKIQSRFEQNKTLYFLLRNEKLAVFAILTLMMMVAAFNIIGSLSMLVLDKENDTAILQTYGLTGSQLVRIFVSCGLILSLLGAGIGAVLAFLICTLQQHFGFVKLGNGAEDNFLLQAYPVEMKWTDFILVFTTVILITLLASILPARRASKKQVVDRLHR